MAAAAVEINPSQTIAILSAAEPRMNPAMAAISRPPYAAQDFQWLGFRTACTDRSAFLPDDRFRSCRHQSRRLFRLLVQFEPPGVREQGSSLAECPPSLGNSPASARSRSLPNVPVALEFPMTSL